MLRGKENNAGDAKVWSVEDDLVVYDHLKSYMPGPKLAKSPKVAALFARQRLSVFSLFRFFPLSIFIAQLLFIISSAATST